MNTKSSSSSLEYERRKHSIMVSSAPIEVREKALKELDAKFNPTAAVGLARKQFVESAPSIDDIGGHE